MITAACALLDGTGSQDRCARAVFTRAYTLFDFWELREITPEASNPHPQLVNFGLKSKTRACREPPKSDFALALRPNSAYVSCMSFCSKAFSLALAIALCACGAEQALARSKKQTADPPVPIITMDDSGTPIIMQGLAIERARKRPGAADEGQPKQRAERPIKISRGSSAYVPPPLCLRRAAARRLPHCCARRSRLMNCRRSTASVIASSGAISPSRSMRVSETIRPTAMRMCAPAPIDAKPRWTSSGSTPASSASAPIPLGACKIDPRSVLDRT